MSEQKKTGQIIEVQGAEIHILSRMDQDYISLTDMVQGFEGGGTLIESWLRNKETVAFLGVWERLNNPSFNSPGFEGIKNEAGLNRFTLSVRKWERETNGIGLIAKTGRYGGGTFAHKDIAFEFGAWLSPEFKLYLIREFQRLKDAEQATQGEIAWNVRRMLAKAQYRAHTDAVKQHLIPSAVTKQQEGFIYATEADLLNVALFGMTAKEWRAKNPAAEGNMRDAATIEQLVVMTALEAQNALLIEQGRSQQERLRTLNAIAIRQIKAMENNPSIQGLGDKPLLDH